MRAFQSTRRRHRRVLVLQTSRLELHIFPTVHLMTSTEMSARQYAFKVWWYFVAFEFIASYVISIWWCRVWSLFWRIHFPCHLCNENTCQELCSVQVDRPWLKANICRDDCISEVVEGTVRSSMVPYGFFISSDVGARVVPLCRT